MRFKVTRISEQQGEDGALLRNEEEFLETETVAELKSDGHVIVSTEVQLIKIGGHPARIAAGRTGCKPVLHPLPQLPCE